MPNAEGAARHDPVEATLVASRALLGVVARSVAAALESVTMPQFRVLIILSAEGPMRMGLLADHMRAVPSTFSRSVDRMVAGGWVERIESPDSRREVLIQLTPQGRSLVDDVTERRRQEIASVLKRMSAADRTAVEAALFSFAQAAGEPSAQDLLVLGL